MRSRRHLANEGGVIARARTGPCHPIRRAARWAVSWPRITTSRLVGARGERAARQMRLQAGHAVGPDMGIVRGVRRQLQAVARRQFDGTVGQAERDRPIDHDDDLVVGVVVAAIPITGTVRPGARVEALVGQARAHRRRLAHRLNPRPRRR